MATTASVSPGRALGRFLKGEPKIFFERVIRTAVLSVFLAVTSAFAQPAEQHLRVATRLIKPFVFEENRALTGFSIELWQEISRQLNARSEFVMKPSVKELLEATRSKEVDLAIAAISITAEREIDWDFSQPMFDAGLLPLSSLECFHLRYYRSWASFC